MTQNRSEAAGGTIFTPINASNDGIRKERAVLNVTCPWLINVPASFLGLYCLVEDIKDV